MTLTKLWQVLRFILVRTFVQPIRDGHLKENRQHPWPAGMRWLVGISVGSFSLLTVLGLAAGRLRATALAADGAQSIPWVTGPFLVVAVVIGLSLGYLVAVHSGWRVQLPLSLLLVLLLAGTPGVIGLGSLVFTLASLAVLLAVGLWRRRRPLSGWEFVLAVAVIGALVISRLQAPMLLGVDVQQLGLTLLGFWVGLLTIITAPSALLAGAAMTEIVVALGSWTARGVWEAVPGPDPVRRRREWAGGLLLGALVVGSLAREGWLAATDVKMDPGRLWLAIGYLLIALLAGLVVLRVAPGSRAVGVPTDVDDLSTSWSRTSWPLALLMAVSIFGGLLVSLAFDVIGLPDATQGWRSGIGELIASSGALVLALVFARRGQTAPCLLASMFAVGLLSSRLLVLMQITFDTRQVVTASVLLATLLLLGLLATRRLTADRGLAIASVLLIGRLHEFRTILDEPLAAIFAATGGGALLVLGLLWRQLTEYERARGNSRALPHYVRVLLALANMTLVGMTVSHFALSGSPGTGLLQTIENSGDSELGGALLLAVLVVGLLLGLRGREGGDQRPGEEFRVDHLLLVEPKLPARQPGSVEPARGPR